MKIDHTTRRSFLKSGGKITAAALAAGGGWESNRAGGSLQSDRHIEVLNPQGRVPLSFIIDDSTCLVNMGHFCMPQFAEAWSERDIYRKPWKTWPREIPDTFVRQFGEWCAEQGVKGKYSIVPYPACVGWLDRELPGWSRKELLDSLKLVRDLMLPNWDIHPEMITHTRVIDTRTGRPLEEISPATMENSFPQTHKSVAELAEYLSYALRILQNCDLPCEGITTPGGFGTGVESELSMAVQESVRSVYRAEIPHYFKYVSEGDESTVPKLEHVSGLGTPDLRVTVNLPSGTGDWFGGWEGDEVPDPAQYLSMDGSTGRLAELIRRGQPGTFLCHWPGMYCNGSLEGYHAFQQVVTALKEHYGSQTIWMKLSEMARYWTAWELTRIEPESDSVRLEAPVACPGFTVKASGYPAAAPRIEREGERLSLREVPALEHLTPGTWCRERSSLLACFDLSDGTSRLRFV